MGQGNLPVTEFDITTTPTLQAVATADERTLVNDLQKRVDEALEQAGEQKRVVEALEAQRDAENRLQQLQTASRNLNATAKELRGAIFQASTKAMDKLIECAASGAKMEYNPVTQLAILEQRERAVGRSIERVVEHLTPRALMDRLRADAAAYLARAEAVENIAQQRAEKILGQLRDAVSDEVVLPVDFSKGVSGALLSHASELRRLAGEAANNAREIEKTYLERNGKE